MHVLCVLSDTGDLARVRDIVRELASRGDTVTLASPIPDLPVTLPDGIAVVRWDAAAAERQQRAAKAVQLALRYLRALEIDDGDAAARDGVLRKLVRLVSARVEDVPSAWSDAGLASLPEERERLRAVLQTMADSLRASSAVDALLAGHAYDVALVASPAALTALSERARERGIPVLPLSRDETPDTAAIAARLDHAAATRPVRGVTPEAAAVVTPPASAAPETIRVDFPDAEIRLYAGTAIERQRAAVCAKEPWTVEWLEDAVAAGEVLYDIGANVGVFSLIAARQCGATVVAFEPGYATFARLCENIQLNGCEAAIVPVPLPLAERTGLVKLRYRHLEAGQSRHSISRGNWHRGDTAAGHYVQPICAVTLDMMVASFHLPAPHHMKIDVDGAELRVLQGAAVTLQSATLRTVLIEVDAGLWDAVHELLTAAGLELRWRKDRDQERTKPLYARFDRRP